MTKRQKTNLLKLTDSELDKAFKIEGTKFDRRRFLSDREIKEMKKLHKKGRKLTELANIFGVSYSTVKYHIDEVFRTQANLNRKKYKFTIDNFAFQDRVAYKKFILKSSLV